MNKSLTAALAGVLTAATVASAQVNIQRSTLNYPLNNTNAWVGDVVPVGTNIAVWDVDATGGNLAQTLGGSMVWGGIQIGNPGGPVTIAADSPTTFTLTLSNGINMFQAQQGLTFNNTNLVVAAAQYWSVGNNQTLTVNSALTRNAGGTILFEFDNSAAQAVIIPTTTTPNALASSYGSFLAQGNVLVATSNDVDFAALSATGQVIGAASLGYTPTAGALYTTNATGTTPNYTVQSGSYDIIDTNSYGIRISTTVYVNGIRFNTPQTNNSGANVFTYNGVGSWEIVMKTGTTLDLNTLLMTTNLGTSAVVIQEPTPGAYLRMWSQDGVSGDTSNGVSELVIIQNNPLANLVVQLPITERTGGSYLEKMGAGTMELLNSGSWSGRTLLYGGTIQLDGPNTFLATGGTVGSSPLTVFSGGNFQGMTGAANTAPVTVNGGGTDTVYVVSANGQFANNTNLTFNAGATTLQFLYSNTLSPTATAPAPLLIANAPLTANDTVGVVVKCGSLSTGQFKLVSYSPSYPLVLGDTFSNVFAITGIEPHVSAFLSNNTASNSIDLVVSSINQPIHWTNSSGNWDFVSSNWVDALGNSAVYEQSVSIGDNVLFSDAASGAGPIVVTLNTNVTPSSVTNNSTKNYTISGTGSINGTGSLTKLGSSTLNLWTTNSFSGGLYIDGGVVNFQDPVNNLGTGTITFNGGTLQYASGNTVDISSLKTVFLSGGATIDTGGQAVTFANPVGSGGAGGLTAKAGAGSLTLNGANTYAGSTVVSSGTLFLGAGASLPDSSAITVNSSTVFDATALTAGFALASGQTLSGTGTVNGEISNGSGTISAAGTPLTFANDLTNNGGAINMAISAANSDLISVTGNLTLTAGSLNLTVSGTLLNGTYPLMSYGTFSGNAGSLAISGYPAGKVAVLSSTAIANRISLVLSQAPNEILVWEGGSGSSPENWDINTTANWLYNGNPAEFENGDTAVFNDNGMGYPAVDLTTTIAPTEVIVSVTNANYSFSGAGNITGSAALVYNSYGSASLTVATVNNNNGGTSIGTGATLTVGNGTSDGDLGSGTITNNGSLVYDPTVANHSVSSTIIGMGSLTQEGETTLTLLASSNLYSGGTTINSSTLQIGNGIVTGSIGPGPIYDNNSSLIFDNAGTLSVTNGITCPQQSGGTVTMSGPGTLILGGSNDYYGNTIVSSGTLKLGSSKAIPNETVDSGATGLLNVNGGTTPPAVFDLAGYNVTVNGLSSTTNTPLPMVTNSGASASTTNILTIGDASDSTTYSGSIYENSTGSKLKVVINMGAPATTFTLDGPATLSGGITVQGGTLNMTANGTGYTGPITMDNSTSLYLATSGETAANNITIANGATASFSADTLGTYFSGQFIGGTTSIMDIIGSMSCGDNTNQWQAFNGTVSIAQAGTLRFSDTGVFTNGGSNALWDVEGVLQVRDTGTVYLGALVGSNNGASYGINGPTVSGTGTYVVGFLNRSTIYSNSFIGTNSLVKVGTGTLTLNGTVTFQGNTTVSNGTLAIVSNTAALDGSTNITVITGSTLDMTGFTSYSPSATLTLGGNATFDTTYPPAPINQTLAGGGTVKGAILELAGSTIAPGDSATATGNLTATGTVTIGGAVQMKLDATNALTSDSITAPSIIVQSGATLVVTNIGPTNFTYGQTFQLFSRGVSGNFATITLPSLGSCESLAWNTNTLTTSGAISVGGTACVTVNTNATNITYLVSGPAPNQTLTLSWPSNQIGWYLEAQTNPVGAGITTNWVIVGGSSNTDTMSFTISTNNDAFYRLFYTTNSPP
jgi:autotransporter-associated beta strand protein